MLKKKEGQREQRHWQPVQHVQSQQPRRVLCVVAASMVAKTNSSVAIAEDDLIVPLNPSNPPTAPRMHSFLAWAHDDATRLLEPSLASLHDDLPFPDTEDYIDLTDEEEVDRLAKEGVNRPTANKLSLDIPKELDIQGAKLSALSQTAAYQGFFFFLHSS